MACGNTSRIHKSSLFILILSKINQFPHLTRTSLRSFPIQGLGLPRDLFPVRLYFKILKIFLSLPIVTTSPAHFNLIFY